MHTPLILSALLTFVSSGVFAADPVSVSFPEPPRNPHVVSDNYLGISWELSSFDTLWGSTPDVIPHSMENYLANIRARMQNPMRIRIGGSGMDISTYDPNLTDRMLNLTDPNAYFNSVPVDFGPLFFQILNKMSDIVGSMQFIIGLSLHDISSEALSRTRILATAAKETLGDKLDALLLGNEPDFYGPRDGQKSYNLPDYISDAKVLLSDLQTIPTLANDTIMGGPTTCCGKWPFVDILEAGLDDLAYKYYSVQNYPIDACGGDKPENTNVTFFLDHSKVTSYATYEHAGVSLAKQQGTPVLLTEYNSVSCGGSSISDIFGMSLWTIDVGLKFASNNFSAAYLHTREYGRKYNLFDPPTASTPSEPNWRTGSPYYTMLVLAEALSATGSTVIDLNLKNSTTLSGVPTVAYGIYDNGGKTRGKLVLINYDVQQSNEDQTFIIPPNLSEVVSIRYLLSPSVTERTNISWAGQTVGQNGELGGEMTTQVINCGSGCNVTVPGPGLALVLFNSTSPDSFYVGNSTTGASNGGSTGDSSGSSRLTGMLSFYLAVLVSMLGLW